MSKLDETTDFIELYVYAMGDWTTPTQWIRWSAMQLIAACVEDRVFLPGAHGHDNLYPNIWVFLIGPGGAGKDTAIRFGLALLGTESNLQMVDGKISISAVYDYMAAHQKATGRESAPMFLIFSDAGEALPLGDQAKDFTSRVLPLYGGYSRTVSDYTRTTGRVTIKNPVLNWILGTTKEWFPQAVNAIIFASGLAGRVFFILGDPNDDFFDIDMPEPPPDKELVMGFLRKKIEAYQDMFGQFSMSPSAKEHYAAWLVDRKEVLQTIACTTLDQQYIRRSRAGIKKLAMIYSLSRWNGTGPLVISGEDMAKAIRASESTFEGMRQISEYAFRSEDIVAIDTVRQIIKEAGDAGIAKHIAARKSIERGIKGKKHFDMILETLKDTREVECSIRPAGPKGGRPLQLLKYRSRKVILTDEDSARAETEAPTDSETDN
jgi:hypothetical protein